MVKPKKIAHLHLVYHFTVPLNDKNFKKSNASKIGKYAENFRK